MKSSRASSFGALRMALVTVVWLAASAVTADDAPPKEATASRIGELIEQLGDDRFAVREAAQAELIKFGPEAFDALTVAENDDDIEIAARARYLLGVVLTEFDWVHDDDPPEVKQALAGYENLDAANRLTRIRKLAERRTPSQLAALCRLVRFEKSPILSKQAALAIMKPREGEPDQESRAAILAGVGDSPRPAAVWLRTYVAGVDKPDDAAARWDEIVAAEERLQEQSSEQSRPEIVNALLRLEVDLLERMGRQEAALVKVERIIERETGERESLVELLRWLVEHKALRLIDTVATRFNERFAADPLLAYTLAEVRQTTGDKAQAQEIAERAFAMNPGDSAEHLDVAQQLNRRGQKEWAIREYRYVIELGPPENINTLNAEFLLAELLHDQLQDKQAGDLLSECLATLEKAAQQGNNNGGNAEVRRLLDAIRNHTLARMNYYYACHYGGEKEHKKEQEHLDKAAQADPLDADVLISLHRLPDQGDDRRKQTEKLIDAAIGQYRAQIAQNPRDATGFNQLAWLLANTDRRQQEALQLSLESIKLRPNEAGLMDTLGHCYFALGDFENAVKAQTKAVELDPHSGLMRRQLEVFRKKLAEKNSA